MSGSLRERCRAAGRDSYMRPRPHGAVPPEGDLARVADAVMRVAVEACAVAAERGPGYLLRGERAAAAARIRDLLDEWERAREAAGR